MAEVTMSLEEYLALSGSSTPSSPSRAKRSPPAKRKRKVSAYSKRYGAAFKRIAKTNKKKNGSWKKGGFTRTQKAAHKAARRK